jgi:hypothetical protein
MTRGGQNKTAIFMKSVFDDGIKFYVGKVRSHHEIFEDAG